MTDDYLIHKDGSLSFTKDQSIGGNKIIELAEGTDLTDAVNVSQLDAKLDHNIPSHDTTALGSELNTLTDGTSSNADFLHKHTQYSLNYGGTSTFGYQKFPDGSLLQWFTTPLIDVTGYSLHAWLRYSLIFPVVFASTNITLITTGKSLQAGTTGEWTTSFTDITTGGAYATHKRINASLTGTRYLQYHVIAMGH